MRVFISSTCYDLLDLRAELEMFFRQAGVEPVMSDSLTSDFQVSPDTNSIETCLANVRRCDRFIIILSNRYGPSLKDAGFADVSATHLEYLEARNAGIPIHMYVRDRLEGDFNTWKSNGATPDLKLSWCRSQKDWKIFEFLEEHRNLSKSSRNNWFWIFRDSIELKSRIRRDFHDAFARASAQALFNSGTLPLVEVTTTYHNYDQSTETLWFSFYLRNVGVSAAVSPKFEIINSTIQWDFATLNPSEDHGINTHWAVHQGADVTLETRLTYSTLQGYKLADDGSLSLRYNGVDFPQWKVSFSLRKRRFLGASDAALLMMPAID